VVGPFLKAKYLHAILQNPEISAATPSQVVRGYRESYMLELGLSKADLKKLERAGMAYRGYSTGAGQPHKVAWALIYTDAE
jgi:hypothetical protein